jgi:adenylosuccinate synthase
MADLVHPESLAEIYAELVQDKQVLERAFALGETVDPAGALDEYQRLAERLRPMVCDTTRLLHDEMAAGRRVLFEGAQGTMLDIDHGTYPFVTSSSAAAGGASTGSGVPPTRIQGIIGVSKAYVTRVGGGPFPSEALGESGDRIRNAGNEFGSVTGRPRRCGWFDIPLIRYTSAVNGFDSLVITKLDVLDQFDEIPVCVEYRSDGFPRSDMPATIRELAAVEVVYERLPGWREPTHGMDRYAKLPDRARRYLDFLSARTGVEIGCISTGPERNQTATVAGSRLEKLIG